MTTKRSGTKGEATLEVIGADNNLESFLRSVTNTRIDIAVAFASKTETLIDHLISNGNKLTLTIGTINHFSDPVFVRHCRNVAKANPSKLSLSVDFRGDNSIHWKVYLVAPDTVVVGSSNLTTTGLSMQRDTAVRIRDKRLYKEYRALIASIRRTDDVVLHSDSGFEELLSEYEQQHRRIILKTQKLSANKQSAALLPDDFITWLNQDTSQILPVFMWERDFTPEEERLFNNKIRPQAASSLTANEQEPQIKGFYLIGVYNGTKSRPHYYDGDLILRMKSTGARAEFHLAGRVIHGMGKWWLCGFERRKTPQPFALTPELRKSIKRQASKWYNVDRAYLDSNELRQLAEVLRNQ